MTRTKHYILSLLKRSWRTALLLIKIMLPVMILIRVLEEFGIIDVIGEFIGPIMSLFGLPAEAGLIWAVALIVGTYPALGALIATLPMTELSVAQMSILSSMILIAHMIPAEQAIVHRAGANFFVTSLMRVFGAMLYGFIANQVLIAFDLLQSPLTLNWTPEGFGSDSWSDWALATAESMLLIFIIIVALFLVLDLFEKIGLNALFGRLLTPLHFLLGIRRELAPLIVVGLLIGISYGSGAIIEYVERNPVSKRDLFLSLSFLSIFHAVIEDTLLFMAFGADIWVVLVGRGVFCVLFMMVIAHLIFRDRRAVVRPAE